MTKIYQILVYERDPDEVLDWDDMDPRPLVYITMTDLEPKDLREKAYLVLESEIRRALEARKE